jgi:hypothetical protein
VASYSGPRPDRRVATSPWTRPPEQPGHYRLTARLSDMVHGWLDGKSGIPMLPEGRIAILDEASGSSAESDATRPGDSLAESGAVTESGAVGESGEPVDAIPQMEAEQPAEAGQPAQAVHWAPAEPWTPRMEVLVRFSRECIEGERIRLADDLFVLMRRAAESRHSVEELTEQIKAHEQALDQARERLDDTDLAKRRLAERDAQSRPDGLVSDRRQAAWDRRLSAAEERYQTTTAQLAQAKQALRLNESLVRERTAVARSAARRHHELALRRVATYLQQLVRTHRRGPELNALLMNYRVGTDLPEWVRDATDEKSGS